eukprot:gene9008-2668_t
MSLRRLKHELRGLDDGPVEGCSAGPCEGTMHQWWAAVKGPVGT